MATSEKTVLYAFPTLASLSDATVTNLTQITIQVTDDSPVFRSVKVIWTCNDIITATGGTITEWRTGLRLAAVAYSTVTNTNDPDNSGENISFEFSADYTSYFNTNWTGAAMTCDLQVYADQSTGTTLGMVNVTAIIEITYEYDDTSSSSTKSVWIPLNAPAGALATSKPGSPTATIPALDTFCPERGKNYLDIFIVIQGNEGRATATTDHTISMEIDSAGVTTTGNYEGALASDRWFRYVWHPASFTKNATHSFYIWGSVARCNHLQVYMVVTYTFTFAAPVTTPWAASTGKSLNATVYGTNASGKDIAFVCTTAGTTGSTQPTWNTNAGDTTTDGTVTWTVLSVLNSLQLPMALYGPMGGTTTSDNQNGSIILPIQEPGPIVDDYCAAMVYFQHAAPIAGINVRVGAGSYVGYTNAADTVCGNDGLMLRCEGDLSLARGYNTLSLDIYRTDATDLGWAVGVEWIINYTSAQHRLGASTHNKTIRRNILTYGTGNSQILSVVSAVAPTIPESNYCISHFGVALSYLSDATSGPHGSIIGVERLSSGGEGGVRWESIYRDASHVDPEAGVYKIMAHNNDLFKRWPGDPGTGRLDLETSRRWRAGQSAQATAWHTLDLVFTYHAITYAVAGTVTGYTGAGDSITVDVHRSDTDEKILSTTTSAGGAYSATWYDNTVNVYVHARQDSTHIGRSDDGVAV